MSFDDDKDHGATGTDTSAERSAGDGVANVSFSIVTHSLREISLKHNFDFAHQNSRDDILNYMKGKPEVKAYIDVKCRVISGNFCENIICFAVNVNIAGNQAYTVQLDYSTLFMINDFDKVPESVRRKLMAVDVSFLSFPFARHILFTVTRDAGMYPIALDMIDFNQVYLSGQNNSNVDIN